MSRFVILLISLFVVFSLFSPSLVPAQWCPGGVDTALGCLQTENINVFISELLSWAAGISGGITLIMIAVGGFMITTSAGDPKKVKAGQEMIYTSITAIVLIVLSVVIVNFLGLNVLSLVAFGF